AAAEVLDEERQHGRPRREAEAEGGDGPVEHAEHEVATNGGARMLSCPTPEHENHRLRLRLPTTRLPPTRETTIRTPASLRCRALGEHSAVLTHGRPAPPGGRGGRRRRLPPRSAST